MALAKVKLECIECCGTGVAENIGGWARPCDACHGEGDIFVDQEDSIALENNERMQEAIAVAVHEVIAKHGIELLKSLSMFNNKDPYVIAETARKISTKKTALLREAVEQRRCDPMLAQAKAIVKQFYPEMPDDYEGRRVQIALAAFQRQQLVKDKIVFAIGEYMTETGQDLGPAQYVLFRNILAILKGNN